MQRTLSPNLRKISTLAAAVGLALGGAQRPTPHRRYNYLSSNLGPLHWHLRWWRQPASVVWKHRSHRPGWGLFWVFNITLTNGNKFVQTGLDLTFGFNLVANPTVTYSALTAGYTIPGGTSPLQSAGSYHENGTGDFEYGVIWGGGAGGGNAAANPVLSFTIGGTGLTLASLEQNAVASIFCGRYHQWHHWQYWCGRRKPGPPPRSTGTRDLRECCSPARMMGFIARRRKQKAA
jgi:hypothetical protein